MQTIITFLATLLAAFRSTAKTVGLSPKALAGPIGLAITGLLALVGATPDAIGGLIGVDAAVVAAFEVGVAAKIAALLLPPGIVVQPAVEFPEPGSDELNGFTS